MDMSAFITDWIRMPDWSPEDDAEPGIACFRHAFVMEKGWQVPVGFTSSPCARPTRFPQC